MRHLSRRAVPLAAAIAALAPGAAHASASPPTITSSFSPATIGIGGTSTLTFTITNPNASSLSGVSFTDALPNGVVVDNPSGENGTCGVSGVVTATTGTGTISLTAGSLKASASCVVSVNVTSPTPGLYANATGVVNSTEGGSSATGDTETLTVAGEPTITVSAPKNNAVFKFGQKVAARFSCADAANGPGITDCSATDNNGSTIAPGGLIDTIVAGPDTLTLSASSADGLIVTTSINYTVLPDNRIVVTDVKPFPSGKVTLDIKVPGKGKLTATVTAGRTKFAIWSDQVNGAKTLHVTLKPGPAGKALLAAKAGKLTVKLKLTYTPKGGKAATTTIGGLKV
jgi:uncharacterized repeat protein (TIGR01451 family)